MQLRLLYLYLKVYSNAPAELNVSADEKGVHLKKLSNRLWLK